MNKKGVIAAISCAFALCLALAGCGGGQSSADAAKEAKEAFAGTWDLVEMTQDGEQTGAEDLEMLKSLGLEVFVNLEEDGTAALVLFGTPLEGTWEAASTTEGTLVLDGQEVAMTITDSKLTFEDQGSSLTFEKGEKKETPSADAATTSAENQAAASGAAESTSNQAADASAAAESASSETTDASAAAESASSEAAAA